MDTFTLSGTGVALIGPGVIQVSIQRGQLVHLALYGVSAVVAFFGAVPITQASVERTPSNGPGLCPNWVKARPRANDSYLVQTGVIPERTMNDAIFDPGASKAMRDEFEAHFDAETTRSNYGLSDPFFEKSRFAVMKDYAKRAVDTMTRIHLREEGDRIAKVAMKSNLPREPIAAAVLAASLYTGRSMRFRIFGGVPVDSRVVLKDRVGSLTMPIASTGITGTFAYNHDDGVCGADNGCAMLSREIVPNVSAMVNSAQKGSARVVYSVSF